MLIINLDFFDGWKDQSSKPKGAFKFLFVTKDIEVLKKALEGRIYQNDEIANRLFFLFQFLSTNEIN